MIFSPQTNAFNGFSIVFRFQTPMIIYGFENLHPKRCIIPLMYDEIWWAIIDSNTHLFRVIQLCKDSLNCQLPGLEDRALTGSALPTTQGQQLWSEQNSSRRLPSSWGPKRASSEVKKLETHTFVIKSHKIWNSKLADPTEEIDPGNLP